jgi:hypothetical protein
MEASRANTSASDYPAGAVLTTFYSAFCLFRSESRPAPWVRNKTPSTRLIGLFDRRISKDFERSEQ